MSTRESYKDEILYFTVNGFYGDKMKHLFSSRIGWDQKSIFSGVERIFEMEDKYIYRVGQVHGDRILKIEDEESKIVEDLKADGLVTNRQGIALCTYHADCVPIYFYDENKRVIGLTHAGWKGTIENIAGKMINRMKDDYGSNVRDIIVGIGPSICPICYEVKSDVSKLFREKYGNKQIVKYMDDKTYLDLWRANEINLLNEGVLKSNINISQLCTSCNSDKLYSYRGENRTKNRMIASIMMEE